jgi:DNA-binding NtrC family response regulator
MAILNVDDDDSVRSAYRRALTVFGFTVVSVEGVAAAKVALAERPDIAGAFLDFWLGDGTGMHVYQWVAVHRPDLAHRIAFVAGDAEAELLPALAALGCPVLRKPCDPEDFMRLAAAWEWEASAGAENAARAPNELSA